MLNYVVKKYKWGPSWLSEKTTLAKASDLPDLGERADPVDQALETLLWRPSLHSPFFPPPAAPWCLHFLT